MENTRTLKQILLVDGAAGLGAGIVMTAGAPLLAGMLDLPQDLLFWAGIALFTCVAFIATMTFRPSFPRMQLFELAVINAVWAVASIVILLAGIVQPNLLGAVFVVGQAALVGGLALLQFAALRNTAAVAA